MGNRFAGFADNGGVPKTPTKAKARLAEPDEDEIAADAKKGTKMGFQKVLPSDSSIVMFAKMAVSQGRSPGLEKDAFYDAIVKRAEALRADGESSQQAFAKVIIEDETGKLLYQAMKIAPGLETKAALDPEQDYVSPGPAHDEINARALTRMKGDPKLSYERAFTNEYTDPKNRPLKSRVDAESILHAQRLEPARPFPAYARG
jgi:hypothetical protein